MSEIQSLKRGADRGGVGSQRLVVGLESGVSCTPMGPPIAGEAGC